MADVIFLTFDKCDSLFSSSLQQIMFGRYQIKIAFLKFSSCLIKSGYVLSGKVSLFLCCISCSLDECKYEG